MTGERKAVIEENAILAAELRRMWGAWAFENEDGDCVFARMSQEACDILRAGPRKEEP